MSESKYTPAPWYFNGDTNEIVGGKEALTGGAMTICTLDWPEWRCPATGETYEDDVAHDANAHLIASAPDMLEALREIVAEYEDRKCQFGDDPYWVKHETDPLPKALDAISEAEGKEVSQ